MKRLYGAAMTLILAVSMTACGGESIPAPSVTAQTPEKAAPAAEPAETTLPVVAGELYPILPSDDSDHVLFNTGDRGYQIQWKNDHGLVTVIDYAAAEQQVLCSVPGCAHDSESCPAYFSGVRQNCQLFVAGDEVYLYKRWEGEYVPDTWEEYEQSHDLSQMARDMGAELEEERAFQRAYYEQAVAPAGLMAVAADGSAKRYVELSQNLGVDSWMRWCDGVALYGYNDGAPGSGGMKGYRVALEDGSVTEFALNRGEWPCGAMGRKLIVNRFLTEVPLPDATENFEAYDAVTQNGYYEFDLLDPATGEYSKLVGDPSFIFDGMFLGQAGGWLYFNMVERDEQGNLLRVAQRAYAPQTDRWQELGGPEMIIMDGNVYALPDTAAWEGRWIWMQGPAADGSIGQMWVVDRQTEQRYAITQKVDAAAEVFQLMFAAALTDDGRFLIPVREQEPYTNRYDYALIGAEAFLQGSTDYTPVKMLA